MWQREFNPNTPEPIPPYPGEEIDRKDQIEAEINELLKEMREIDYARAKK